MQKIRGVFAFGVRKIAILLAKCEFLQRTSIFEQVGPLKTPHFRDFMQI